MSKVIIMSGISGSGKSTYIKNHYPDAVVCSADHYFHDLANKEGKTYDEVFDPALLGEAHKHCLRKFIQCLSDGVKIVACDNTNTSAIEVAPYASVGQAFGYDVKIIIIDCLVKTGMKRNVHNVPNKTIKNQQFKLERMKLPKWWNVERVSAEGV
jgi:predicted kinase